MTLGRFVNVVPLQVDHIRLDADRLMFGRKGLGLSLKRALPGRQRFTIDWPLDAGSASPGTWADPSNSVDSVPEIASQQITRSKLIAGPRSGSRLQASRRQPSSEAGTSRFSERARER